MACRTRVAQLAEATPSAAGGRRATALKDALDNACQEPGVDKVEARRIAQDRLEELRSVPFAELAEPLDGKQEVHEVVAASGTRYQLEAQAFREGENLHVMVSADDGGWRAFLPVSDSFIVAPDGSFVGE